MQTDSRYRVEAYLFAQDAFLHAMAMLGERRGLTGKELLQGIKSLGRERFGPTARLVFEHWGVKTTEDFGWVIMNMVEAGLMRKTEEDSIEDFRDVFDFQEEFEKKFQFRLDRNSL